jgi:hypothetical protein
MHAALTMKVMKEAASSSHEWRADRLGATSVCLPPSYGGLPGVIQDANRLQVRCATRLASTSYHVIMRCTNQAFAPRQAD